MSLDDDLEKLKQSLALAFTPAMPGVYDTVSRLLAQTTALEERCFVEFARRKGIEIPKDISGMRRQLATVSLLRVVRQSYVYGPQNTPDDRTIEEIWCVATGDDDVLKTFPRVIVKAKGDVFSVAVLDDAAAPGLWDDIALTT